MIIGVNNTKMQIIWTIAFVNNALSRRSRPVKERNKTTLGNLHFISFISPLFRPFESFFHYWSWYFRCVGWKKMRKWVYIWLQVAFRTTCDKHATATFRSKLETRDNSERLIWKVFEQSLEDQYNWKCGTKWYQKE